MRNFTIVRFIVGELGENAYIVSDISINSAYIIDPGDSAETLETHMLINRLTPCCILLTHGHSDHWGAAWEMANAFSIPVFMSKKDAFLLSRDGRTYPDQNTELFHIPPHTTDIRAFPTYDFPIPIDVIPTPGHTPGSVSFVAGNAVFSGDTLFADGDIGEWRYRGGNKDDLFSSIKQLLGLPGSYVLYPGHGESQILEDCAKIGLTRYTELTL